VSCDFSGKTQEHNEKIFELLVRHLVMRFGRADYRSEVDGTVYWNTSKTRSGRQGEKELVLYRDKVSKITGQKCVHLELRIYGAQARAFSGRSESISTHRGFPNSCKSDSVFATSNGEGYHGKRLFDGLESSCCGLGRGR
jgi:hypothetical protein